MYPRLDINFSYNSQWQFYFGEPYMPTSDEFLLNHGRSGILLALQSLCLPKDSKVGVMAYNCHTVFSAILSAGCTPIFLDVTNDLLLDLNDLKNKNDFLSAIVVTHLFGIENDMSAIRNICADIPIIEDCAHNFGRESEESDFVCYSIGQGKLPSIGDGGILKVRNLQYLSAVRELYDRLKSYGIRHNIQLFCKLFFKSLIHIPIIYSSITIHLKHHRKSNNKLSNEIRMRKMSSGISAIYNNDRKIVGRNIEERKINAHKLAECIESVNGVERVYIGESAFMLVVYCRNSKELQRYFLSHDIDCAVHFGESFVWRSAIDNNMEQSTNAQLLSEHLLMLPTYINIENKLHRI